MNTLLLGDFILESLPIGSHTQDVENVIDNCWSRLDRLLATILRFDTNESEHATSQK